MSEQDRARWDAKYAGRTVPTESRPDPFLADCVRDLTPGTALELACGTAGNAIWLAQQGWQVDAVDISPVGLQLARTAADRAGANVNFVCADLDAFSPAVATYDLVVVFRFLDRDRLPGLIVSALRPGGRLVYETFTERQLARPDSHLKNPAFALASGELPRLFPELETLHYAECDEAGRSVARWCAVRSMLSSDPGEPAAQAAG